MDVAYEIVYVRRDRTEELIRTVTDEADIQHIVEMPQYMGTWISKTRKLLRYGRGELHIRRIEQQMKVSGHAFTEDDDNVRCLLNIAHGGNLAWITIEQHKFIGYPLTRHKPLWIARSIPELMSYVDKPVAFECVELYDAMCDNYKLKNAM